MKKKLLSLFCLLLIACMILPTATAEDPAGYYIQYPDDLPGTVNKVCTNHEWKVVEERPATCLEPGYQMKVCSICGYQSGEEIPAKGHSWGEWKVTKDATCSAEGQKTHACTVCGATETQSIPKNDVHSWGAWQTTKQATCTEDGTQTRTCSACGKTETQTIPKTGAHKFGDWQTTKEATCTSTGTRTRTCSVCGKTETETLPKLEHDWTDWEVIKEPTCTENGKRSHRCKLCGELQYLQILKLGHEAEEWTVTKEPTCQKAGQKTGACVRCGKELKENIPKVSHDYSEWELDEEATLFSKGKRHSVCRFCKKKKTEEFYPDGTLAKDLDNDPDEVKEFQQELKAEGYLTGKITGVFDKDTINAVKKMEKAFDLPQDGIGWPGLRMLLGLGGSGGDGEFEGGMGGGPGDEAEGISVYSGKYKLQLSVKRISEAKEYYTVGDEITYEWTLKNASTKSPSKNTKMFFFKGTKYDKATAELIEDIGDLGKGAEWYGTYKYTVTTDDALSGKFRVNFIGTGKLGTSAVKSNPVWFVHMASAGTGGISGWTPPEEESLVITKTVSNKPKNNVFFTKGETIKFTIEIKNKGSKDVDDVIVTDKLFGDSWKKTVGTLASGDSKVYDVEYTVKVGDLSSGEVVNTAVVSYTEDGKAKMSKATVKAPVGMNSDGLYIYKTCTNLPKNGLFFVPGEIIEFEIQIFNPTTDKTFTNLELFDWLYSKKDPYKTVSKLTPGSVVTFVYKTKCTEMRAKAGKLTNSVMVNYKDPKKKKRVSLSNQCTVPCGLEGADGVVVTKKVISTPKNGGWYQEGEEIRYEIDITNNTVKDILTMDIRDSLASIDENGYRTVQAGEKLAAGETYSIHFSYVVTAADVENTKVTNIANVWWSVKEGEFTDPFSDPVTVPTQEVLVHKQPDLKTLEGDSCTPALTAVGDGMAQRDLTECEDHTETAKEADILINSGDYKGAADLWEDETDELYAEWKLNTDGEAKRIAENEEAAYNHQMSALEASVGLVCSVEDKQAIMAEERMEKCVELCYELHAAPEERPDSLSSAQTGLKGGRTEDECSRAVIYSAEGPMRAVDDRCDSHTLTTQLTDVLLEAAEDDEDKIYAWQRAQANWLLELDTMYDTWYLSADAEQRALIAADRISFDKLINARMESLAYLYPDDPAAQAEVLCNMIMHRTELICRILHDAGVLDD